MPVKFLIFLLFVAVNFSLYSNPLQEFSRAKSMTWNYKTRAEAAKMLRKFLTHPKFQSEAALYLGICYQEDGKYQEAVKAFPQAIDKGRGYVKCRALFRYAACLQKLNRPVEALRYAGQAVTMNVAERDHQRAQKVFLNILKALPEHKPDAKLFATLDAQPEALRALKKLIEVQLQSDLKKMQTEISTMHSTFKNANLHKLNARQKKLAAELTQIGRLSSKELFLVRDELENHRSRIILTRKRLYLKRFF